jgi:hypothetical protein
MSLCVEFEGFEFVCRLEFMGGIVTVREQPKPNVILAVVEPRFRV